MTLDRRFSFFQNSAHPTWMSIFTIGENQRPVVNWRKTQCQTSRKQYTNYIYWTISYNIILIIHSGFESFKSLITGNTSSKIAPKKKIDRGTDKESGAPMSCSWLRFLVNCNDTALPYHPIEGSVPKLNNQNHLKHKFHWTDLRSSTP